MMWYPGFNSWDCLCGSTAPDFGFYSGAFANYPESCNAASGVMYYTLGSPFVFQECWYSATMDQRDIDAGGQKGVVHDLSSCFALCSSWQYTFYGSNRDAEPPLCNCGNYPATDPDGAGTGCGMMNSFSFKQDAVVPEPSGEPARRRRRLAELERQQVLANNPYCPVGSQACRVAPGAGGYECLHTESELESCGGCRYGVHGGANATATGIE
ncbi:hypothetical protein Q8F55_005970 [Vanrija albida]|uniref:WSC domain-containing protein n=1 Tax=Vanrija albida TaxID=181172 RepID=A0ABR3Q3V6_9TREE